MSQLATALKSFATRQAKTANVHKPVIYNLKKAADLKKFRALMKLPGIKLHDEIHGQLRELIKTENPKVKFTDKELDAAVIRHLKGSAKELYGVWVYYPWSHRLVHILGKKEFIRVRTSRNCYKITRQEQATLATKVIGVVGLSVGQSVSVTLAMERICGELRLADFDHLELTNLNRIRTGVQNLGLPKVYSVAREIAEIDPFIKVRCFPKGLNEKNMDSFFTGGGKMDLLVEESDGFDIKILCRYKARELKIPVVMEASDRCMVDVERFDLEPKRSILHGLVDHLDIGMLRTLKTTEEKIPYMLDVLGIETASTRLKASMIEIEQTINTWPQLASAVTMGGGITADVCRRILLDHYRESGRYHVDVEELIGNKVEPATKKHRDLPQVEFDFEKAASDIPVSVQEGQEDLKREDVAAIVNSGCRAPSGGNNQPWRWVYKNKCLLLFNAYEPDVALLDYDSLASLIALGAAVENVEIHAAHLGLNARTEFFPNAGNERLVAVIRFFRSAIPDSRADRFSAIGLRMTNRTIAKRTQIDPVILERLKGVAASTKGASLRFITNDKELDAAGDLLGELEKIRLMDKRGHHDFVNEMRWTLEENEQKRDGVDIRTVHLTNAELAGFNMVRDEKVLNLVVDWKGGDAFKRFTKKGIDGAGALGIISMDGNSKTHYLTAGRVLEKVWMEANFQGLSFQPTSASLFLYARLLRGGGKGLEDRTCQELRALRPLFDKIFSITKNLQEMFIFRLTNCGEPEVKSLRKPLEEMFRYVK